MDELLAAVKMFETRHIKEFKDLTCYPILKEMPKFNIDLCRNNKASQFQTVGLESQDDVVDLSPNANTSSSGTEDEQGSYAAEQPFGRDRTKASAQKCNKLNDLAGSGSEYITRADDFRTFISSQAEKKEASQCVRDDVQRERDDFIIYQAQQRQNTLFSI